MNRILSIMLAVCMLAGCAPLALAREITPAVNTIYAIDIWDIDYPPVAGEKAGDHRSVSTSAGAHFSCDALVWNNIDENRLMDDDDVFEAGVTYSFGGLLYANSGYEFDTDWSMSLNFGDIEYDAYYTTIMPDHTQFRFWTEPVQAVTGLKITEIALTGIHFPAVAGDKVADHLYAYPAEGSDFTCAKLRWYDDDAHVAMENNDVFVEGGHYSFGLSLHANSGYEFAENPHISLNDCEVPFDPTYCAIASDPTIFYVWTISEAAVTPTYTPITGVEITHADLYPEPDVTAIPYGEVEDDAPYTIKEMYWTDEYGSLADYCFSEGYDYSLNFDIEAKEGYLFTYVPTVTINGRTDVIDASKYALHDGGRILHLQTVLIECTETIPEVITEAAIVDIAYPPKAGADVDDYRSASPALGAHFTVQNVFWYDEDAQQIKNSGTFEEGVRYSVEIEIKPDSGYVFDENLQIKLNGGEIAVNTEKSYAPTAWYYFVWSEATLALGEHPVVIENVDIIGLQFPPVPGEKAGDTCAFSFVDNSHFSVKFCSWHDDTDGNWMQHDDVFTEGHLYSFDIDLNADHGYIFDEEKTHVTINGSTEIIDFIYTQLEGGILSVWTIAAEATDTLPYALIESISISDVDTTPIAGDRADMHINYAWPADGHYTVAEAFWFNYDTNEQLEPSDEFVAGMRYQIVFRVVPDEGYRFAPYAVITINGGEVDGESGVREEGTFAMVGSLCEEAKVPGSDILIGDVNRDGKVNTADAVQVLKYAAGMISFDNDQLIAANTNKDDKVNTADAVLILKYAAGMISAF